MNLVNNLFSDWSISIIIKEGFDSVCFLAENCSRSLNPYKVGDFFGFAPRGGGLTLVVVGCRWLLWKFGLLLWKR